jgi:hypothetical protein
MFKALLLASYPIGISADCGVGLKAGAVEFPAISFVYLSKYLKVAFFGGNL